MTETISIAGGYPETYGDHSSRQIYRGSPQAGVTVEYARLGDTSSSFFRIPEVGATVTLRNYSKPRIEIGGTVLVLADNHCWRDDYSGVPLSSNQYLRLS